MSRQAGWLPPSKGRSIPSNVVFVDTETYTETSPAGDEHHSLRFGWAQYRQRRQGEKWTRPRWARFDTPAAFWDWLEPLSRPRTILYVYAHNAPFDLTVLRMWSELPKRGWRIVGAVLDAPPFVVRLKRGRHTLILVDSLNIYKVPLESLGKAVGMRKLPQPQDVTDRASWDRYCRRDVKILAATMLRWWRQVRERDLGNAGLTLAGQAFTAWRHGRMTHPVFLDNEERALALARQAYCGARVECNKLGTVKGPVYNLDVRSLYPAVMARELYPTRYRRFYRRVEERELAEWLMRYSVVAHVDLETEEPAYPMRDELRLLFPVGRFSTYLTSGELAYAHMRGHIRKIHCAALYDQAPVFRTYVEDLYAYKEEAERKGNALEYLTAKLLLNSLYGKFGQWGYKDRIVAYTEDLSVRVMEEVDLDTGEVFKLRQVGGMIQEVRKEGESRYSHPAIAAHVTAFGRLHLWERMSDVPAQELCYVDTDSLWCTAAGRRAVEALHAGTGLGDLRCVGEYRSVRFYGAKDYRADGERHTKGIRPSARWVGEHQVEQEEWLGLRSLLYRGDLDTPVVRPSKRVLTRRYTKGKVSLTGDVRPWRLPDEWGAWSRDRDGSGPR